VDFENLFTKIHGIFFHNFCGEIFHPPHKLFDRFGEPSPHGFVLNTKYGKTLSAVSHQQKMRPTYTL